MVHETSDKCGEDCLCNIDEEEAVAYLQAKGFEVKPVDGDPEHFWNTQFPFRVIHNDVPVGNRYRTKDAAINYIINNDLHPEAYIQQYNPDNKSWMTLEIKE